MALKRTKTTSKKKPAADNSVWKSFKPLDYVVIVVSLGLVGFGLWHTFIADKAADNRACAQFGREPQVAVKADVFTPSSITVNRCDRLVISNQGSETYEFMLGTYDKHLAYPGFGGQTLRPGEYFTFDALKTGSVPMHDHTRDKARLQITINE